MFVAIFEFLGSLCCKVKEEFNQWVFNQRWNGDSPRLNGITSQISEWELVGKHLPNPICRCWESPVQIPFLQLVIRECNHSGNASNRALSPTLIVSSRLRTEYRAHSSPLVRSRFHYHKIHSSRTNLVIATTLHLSHDRTPIQAELRLSTHWSRDNIKTYSPWRVYVWYESVVVRW